MLNLFSAICAIQGPALCRLPCHLLEILGKINRAEVDYKKIHGSLPDEEYVAKTLKLSVEKVQMVKQVYPEGHSLSPEYSTTA